jgi:hypothetical protein
MSKPLESQLKDVVKAAEVRVTKDWGRDNPTRMSKLRAYTYACIAPLLDHLDAGLITKNELMLCLTAGAVFVSRRRPEKDKEEVLNAQ